MSNRETSWRQGLLLTVESSLALNLTTDQNQNPYVVVISHDCDIPHENEPSIAVIIGKKLATVDASLTAAKNVRRIHIRYKNPDTNQELFIELQHCDLRFIPKADFFELAKADSIFELHIDEKRILKHWLAARYGRSAFPNAFETRIKTKKFNEKLINILKPLNPYLIGLFVDLGEERFAELAPGNPYYMRMAIVYESTHHLTAKQIAETCAHQINDLFLNSFGAPEIATELILDDCRAVADVNFSLADIRKSDQMRFEYLSLRETPSAPFLPTG